MGFFRANDEANNVNEHNMVKNPNWQEADQLAIYKHDSGVELARVHQETTPAKWSGRDLNSGLPYFKSGTLTTRPSCLSRARQVSTYIFLHSPRS